MESEAHRRIAQLVKRQGAAKIEHTLGVADGTVRAWLKGRTPQPRIRERVAELLGVPVEAWGERARRGREAALPVPETTLRRTSPPAPGSTAPATPEDLDPRANAMATLRVLRRHLEEADRDEIPSLANAITSSSRLLARLTGQLEITESQIVRSGPFRRAMTLLEEALVPFPEATRAVAEAFARFGT